MKLTNWIRDDIAKKVIDDVFTPKQKAYEDILRKETERFVFITNNRKQDTDIVFNNIKEYIHTTNEVKLNFKLKSDWCHLREYVTMDKSVVLLTDEYSELNYDIDKDIDSTIYKILVAGNKLDEEKKAAQKALHTVLNSANTVKQLLDLKPDFAKYIKDNEKPKQTTALVPQKDLDYVSNILKEANKIENA